MSTDLRTKVESDRGLVKQIELAIPGFRGYRVREDLRVADSLLRKQLADRISHVKDRFETVREGIIKGMQLALIEDVKNISNNFHTIENRIRHAEQGYTGISPDFKVMENELNQMYEMDLSLIANVQAMAALVGAMNSKIIDGKPELAQDLAEMKNELLNFSQTFDGRREAFAGLGAF